MGTFASNCALPPDNSTFVTVGIRSTTDIIWSCLSVLVICTWSILHLNVPIQSSPKGKSQKYTRAAFRTWSKVKWMLLNLAAPEWAIGKAWSDYCSVSEMSKRFERYRESDDVPWSRTHTYFANMGGFRIKFDGNSATPAKRTFPHTPKSSLNHAVTSRATNRPMADGPKFESEANSIFDTTCSRPVRSGIEDLESVARGKMDLTFLKSNCPHDISSDATEQQVRDAVAVSRNGVEVLTNESTPLPSTTNAIAAISIPSYIRHGLDLHFKRYMRLDHHMERRVNRESYWIGDISWEMDSSNMEAVCKALNMVRLQHFASEFERARFHIGWEAWFRNLLALQGNTWILDANQLLLAREFGIIEMLPTISEDEIEDRSKADIFVKMIALFQVLWFVTQLCTRLGRHLTTTLLEILTLAFAACTSIMYVLSLDKPKDAQVPVMMSARNRATPEQLIRIAVVGPRTYGWMRYRPYFAIPNNAIHIDTKRQFKGVYRPLSNLSIAGTSALVVFGCIHCVAWEFTFPTQPEKILWHASSITTIITFPVFLIITSIALTSWRWVTGEELGIYSITSPLLSIPAIFLAIFIGARIFMIVEAFRSLAFLPADAFVSTWAANLPHIG